MAALSQLVANHCQPLPDISSKNFGSFFDSFGSARVVLIGDASHGTSEFYRARAAITQHLITHHAFTTIAIEGDWPDTHTIDNHVRAHPSHAGKTPISVFKHFPEWMWRNREMQDFVDWLRVYNASLPVEQRTGIYGLDLYSMGASMKAVIEYLKKVEGREGKLVREARSRYACLEPWIGAPEEYGARALRQGAAPCEDGVVRMLNSLLEERLRLLEADPGDGERFFNAEMNARLVRDAEKYYRAMYRSDAVSWNLRDEHMFGVLERLLETKGGKVVVWAHNSHLGDARATGMKERKEWNLGQLCRERFGEEDVAIIGMGTHDGEVAAAEDWDADMRVMKINPSRGDSWERVMHDTEIPRFLLDMRPGRQEQGSEARSQEPPDTQNRPRRRDSLQSQDQARHDEKSKDELRLALSEAKKERFIGVIYRPGTEKWSHYIESKLSKQFDAYVWMDRTSPVQAFEVHQPQESVARGETYPFGL